MLFFDFGFFLFSKFQMAISKNLMELLTFFKTDFEGSDEVLLRHKYFWSTYFWQWNDGPFKFFQFPWICILFLYFFWMKEVLQSHFWLHIQNVLHYANLNSSSKNKPISPIYGPLNILLRFFSIFYLCFF